MPKPKPSVNGWCTKKQSKQNENNMKNNEASYIDNLPTYGYPGFRLYFPDESNFDNAEKIIKNVSCFERYIELNQVNYCFKDILKDKFFIMDYKCLIIEDDIFSTWDSLKLDIINNSEYCLNCMGLAMHQYIGNREDDENIIQQKDIPIIRARIINFEPILQLKQLKVNYYGKLVSIKGTVIKAGHVKVICRHMVFYCSICSGTQIVKQVDGAYAVPNSCQSKGCRAQSNFVPLHLSPFNRTVSWQSIKIQELLGTEQSENARIPRTLECELVEDLVKSCIPGDDVTITGVLKVRDIMSNNGKNKQNTIFNLYLEAVSISNNKKQNNGSYAEGITFNTNDYYLIQEIHSDQNLFRLLVQSLCPSIYGNEVVKAGLLLALFGGTKSETFRAESHILMVGDPGLGKSQMLQACTNVASRGVYVCGNTSTSSGLTVTMTREGSEYALEAGALMLADQGCCCIDEFDKMPSQHACLLEAMEQQSISIAKAGIVCTLPTRTTILAAANPAGGHYDKSKTIAENLKISSPMLSRFDLIFILLDQPNEHLDWLLSKHVLGVHLGCKKTDDKIDSSSSCDSSVSGRQPLSDRLKAHEDIDPLPHNLFRKYIAYAQKYVNPQLSEEAKQVLKKFYLTLRKQFQIGDCTPVTTRQLNSLIRLTQARAKTELREEATKDDALDVIEIMKFSLVEIFTDEHGVLDKSRSQNGTGMSTKNQVMLLEIKEDIEVAEFLEFGIPPQVYARADYFDTLDEVSFQRCFGLFRECFMRQNTFCVFKEYLFSVVLSTLKVMKLLRLLQRKSDVETRSLFSTKEMRELGEQVGIVKEKFFNILQSLNIQGFLLNKGQNNYQLVTADV